ncbi:hypothetical protein PRK78_001077 [Emydomyces testavorans]|uniref:CHY-type domain-containing protein n=1 Tax=Emydomyces testavorans TaxID=2070801 RepID=A0AAF0IF43_9EURO|nr:hypothetical protein PRK78_001077 [Emydomyces testavorans]
MQSVRSNQAQSDSQAVSPRASVFTIENNGCNNVDFDTHLAPGREIESRPRVGQLEPPPRSPPDRAHGTNSPTQTSPNHDEPLSLWEEPPIHSDSRRSGIYRAFQQNSESREALASAPWNERSSSHTSSRSHSQTNHGQLVEENDLRLLVENEVWGDKGQSLPADDGMRILRQRIHGIRESHTSKTEKARQIHAIMTENYRSLLKVSEPAQSGLQRGAIQSHERPLTPLSSRSKRSSDQFTLTPESLSSAWSTSGSPYYLSLNDLTPTYVPRLATSSQSYGDDDLVLSSQTAEGTDLLDGEVQQELGCQHYKRNVKLQCYTCKRWHTCRFCHDDVEDHTLNRHKTENMLCMVCQTPQQASHWCKSCGTQAACYYCGLCKLWDNDPSKSIYHCHDCGICRRGQGLGKDFFHCKVLK